MIEWRVLRQPLLDPQALQSRDFQWRSQSGEDFVAATPLNATHHDTRRAATISMLKSVTCVGLITASADTCACMHMHARF